MDIKNSGYDKEIELIKRMRKMAESDDISTEELQNGLRLISLSFSNFIKETAKISKVADTFQHKLVVLNESVKAQKEELLCSNEIKDALFSVISHDLRGAIGNNYMLLKEISSNISNFPEKEKDEVMLMMRDSLQRSYTLLINLLDWSKIEKGDVLYKPQNVNIKEAIAESIEFLYDSANSKSIQINYTIDEDIFAFVDNFTIKTVFRNIISNAIKYTKRNGIVDICARANVQMLELDFIDNGVGMTQDKIDSLLSNKVNISEYGTAGEKGTGIGFALCRDFIFKNKGSISIESESGKGTKVRISLPKS